MAKLINLLTKEQVIAFEEEKKKTENRPRWFVLSYDAGEKIREKELNEREEIVEYRKYCTDDFRKVIIRTLREDFKVDQMDEPVETTILFKDPRSNISVDDKIKYWEKKFDDYNDDFYYVITAIYQDTYGSPYKREFPNSTLQGNFQKLLKEVRVEELTNNP